MGECAGSLAEAVRPLGKHVDAVKALARGDVKRLLAGPGEGDVSWLAGHGEGSEICSLGVEHLNAHHAGDVDAIVAIDRHAVGTAWLALGSAPQGREFALVGDCAVRLDIKGPHDGARVLLTMSVFPSLVRTSPLGSGFWLSMTTGTLPPAGR